MKKSNDPGIPSARNGDGTGFGVETNSLLKDRLVAAAIEEFEGAGQKMQNTSYWGNVGFVEASAVEGARNIIDEVPLELTQEKYRQEIVRRFDERIEIYRRDDDLDPDGYGLGTLYAILRKAGLFED